MPTPDIAAAALRCVLEIEDYFRGVIAERRRNPGEDLIPGLLAAEESGSILHEQELLSTCTMVLFGGHETTTNLIAKPVIMCLQATIFSMLRVQPLPQRIPKQNFSEERFSSILLTIS